MRPHRGHRRGWMLARGLHRRVVGFLGVAVLLGGGAGFLLHASIVSQHSPWSPLCVVGSLAVLLVPLSWVATFRIARPVSELAKVAAEIHGGRLTRRKDLATGNDEVGEISDAVRGMADRLAKQLEDQRSLMAAVSHELRSPLARVRVMVELAREGQAAQGIHDDLQSEIDGMDALVGDLLAAARIDFEAVSPTELEVRQIALRALDLAALSAGVLQVEGEAGRVRADATLVARALAVLLDNAQRYGGDTVLLRVMDQGERVRFEVDDDGPGFGPGEEVQAFQPFWRRPPTLEASSPSPAGVGLGLALVRQIAQAHGGAAGADNREEGGARVWLELPR